MTSATTLPPTSTLENDSLALEYLTQAGPRIIGLRTKGSAVNLLGSAPSLVIPTPYGDFTGRGGHRLWHSPEAFPRSYIPDNDGLLVERWDLGVTLAGQVETAAGIQKKITIELPPSGAEVTLQHTLTNFQAWPVELAAWAITILPLGGIAILPDQLPGTDPAALLPDRHWSLWPYTDWRDPRIDMGNDLVLISASPRETPVKLGYANRTGWIAFYNRGTLLIKRFNPLPGAPYPDFGCNAECYCKNEFLELETLGPLTTLQPGESLTHTEVWKVVTGLSAEPGRQGLRNLLEELGLYC